MPTRDHSTLQAEVENLVRALNAAWVDKRIDDLYPLFHEHVVMLAPGASERLAGREAMVESFRQFVAAATIHDFQVLNLQTDVFGATAIASLRFRIRYELKGQVFDEEGTDILVLAREGDAWQIVWRTQVPSAR